MDPMISSALIGLGGSLLGGFFGQQQPELPPELQVIYRQLMKQARMYQNMARTPPLALPQEQMALASARGDVGNLLNQRRSQAEAAFGAPGAGNAGNKADFLSNIAGMEVGQLAGVTSQHLLASLNSRDQYRNMATGALTGAIGAGGGQRISQPTPDFGGLFGQLAQMVAYNQNRSRSGGATQISGLNTGGVPGGVPGSTGQSGWAGPDPRSPFGEPGQFQV